MVSGVGCPDESPQDRRAAPLLKSIRASIRRRNLPQEKRRPAGSGHRGPRGRFRSAQETPLRQGSDNSFRPAPKICNTADPADAWSGLLRRSEAVSFVHRWIQSRSGGPRAPPLHQSKPKLLCVMSRTDSAFLFAFYFAGCICLSNHSRRSRAILRKSCKSARCGRTAEAAAKSASATLYLSPASARSCRQFVEEFGSSLQ